MTLNITNGQNTKPAATQALVDILKNDNTLKGELITGFPILQSSESITAADGIFVTPDNGVIILDIVEGTDLGDFENRQDSLLRMLQSKLLQHSNLVQRRKLIPELHTITFAPAISRLETGDDTYHVANSSNFIQVVQELPTHPDNTSIFRGVLSAIQNLASLGKNRTIRNVVDKESRGAKLFKLEDSIATLDNLQSRAVIETVEGVQRIRGLAGSGKTVVLALKAAYLHTLNPDWVIAVTFNTRSLSDQFRKLISSFYVDQTGTEPNWKNLRILNAWGSPSRGSNSGIYSTYCMENNTPFHNLKEANDASGSAGNAFEWACQEALQDGKFRSKKIFDAILVDEAQDLPSEFLRLCFQMLGPERRLVYAYDELQSLNGRGVDSPEVIFGKGPNGKPLVSLTAGASGQMAHDIVLQKCYRNSRPVLVTAHALGFGIYRQAPAGRSSGLVQLFNNETLWSDIGYSLGSGVFEANNTVTLERNEEASPRFLETHSNVEDLISFKSFDTIEQQNQWVTEQIVKNITEEELNYDDIVVINPNAISARRNLAPLRAQLLTQGITNHLAGVDTSADEFFKRETNSITFTGIHRAKGNEAGMIYVVNAQEGLDSIANLSSVRNRLFTAITRSKAWVRVVGVGEQMQKLIQEFNEVKEHDFTLRFRYPSEKEREEINLVHREINEAQARTIDRGRNIVNQLLKDLEQEQLLAHDLDPEIRNRLLHLLKEKDDD